MTASLTTRRWRAILAALDVDFHPDEAGHRPGPGVAAHRPADTRFDHLVLATGATPSPCPARRQRFLRTSTTRWSEGPARGPGSGGHVGAGWIGAELATAAARTAARSPCFEPAPTPVAAAVGPEVGERTARWYAEAGGTADRRGVDAVQPGGLALAGGGWIAADEVVTAVGVRPAHRLARRLRPQLETAWPRTPACAPSGPALRGRRLFFVPVPPLRAAAALRALGRGAARARSHRGQPPRRRRTYDPVPYFWSEQFGRMVQYIGYHADAGRLIWRGDPA